MGAIRVMVVDDHELVRFALRAALDDEDGIDVVAECSDGQEAVDVVGEVQPDVVVMDLSMPRLNGVEATRQILEREPAVRVLVLTSAPHGELAARALEAGAHTLLAKGLNLDPLIAAIRAVA